MIDDIEASGGRVWTHFGGHPYSWLRRNLVEDSVLMVDLSGTGFTEFSDLRQLKGLMNLNLDGTEIEDLSPLADLTRLQNLFLSNTRVSDLTAISALPGLRSLDVSGTLVRDIAALSGKQLEELSLARTDIRDLSPLAGMELSKLILSGMQQVNMTSLPASLRVKRLNISDTGIKDVTPLLGLYYLDEVDLTNTPVVPSEIDRLKEKWPSCQIITSASREQASTDGVRE